ncbi:MAG: SDR family oxidoreductase [Planctomycetota bacterium]
MRLDLGGQVALVSGGTGGIGRAVLAAFEAAGAAAYGLDLRAPAAPARFLEADVTCPRAVAAALARLVEEAGRLDHLVCCAGITRDRALWKLSDEEWSAVLRVNLDGAFHLLRAATPLLRGRPGASVVLVASINGERGKRGQANYAASKGGLIALGKTAARELGHFGVRVNVVSPGLIETELTAALPAEVLARAREEAALARAGRPEDVAHAAVFLASPLAAHITGQVLRVDGGQLI